MESNMIVPTDPELYELAQRAGNVLLKDHKWLCTAESCTGGWLGKVLTDVAGSSAWYDRGFITYTNQAKHDLLGVDSELLVKFGAVSEESVRAMAQGALENSLADHSVAITGIAGPAGGTEANPVGLVWFAWAERKNSTVSSESVIFDGDREAIRRQAVRHVLKNIT